MKPTRTLETAWYLVYEQDLPVFVGGFWQAVRPAFSSLGKIK